MFFFLHGVLLARGILCISFGLRLEAQCHGDAMTVSMKRTTAPMKHLVHGVCGEAIPARPTSYGFATFTKLVSDPSKFFVAETFHSTWWKTSSNIASPLNQMQLKSTESFRGG